MDRSRRRPIRSFGVSCCQSLLFRYGGWRSYLLGLRYDFACCFVFAYFFVSSPRKPKIVGKEAYLNQFQTGFFEEVRSCLPNGSLFRQAGLGWAVVYSVTFYRSQFGLSLASGAFDCFMFFGIVASTGVVGGHLVNRFGRRRQVVATLAVSYLLLATIPFIPNLWIVLIINFVSALFRAWEFLLAQA